MNLRGLVIKNLLIVSVMLCINVWGDSVSNHLIDPDIGFFTNTNTTLAYKIYLYYEKNGFSAMSSDVYDAKMWMWSYWFSDALDDCRFNELLLDFQQRLEDKNVRLHTVSTKLKRSKKIRRIFGWSMFAVGIISGGWLGWQVRSTL